MRQATPRTGCPVARLLALTTLIALLAGLLATWPPAVVLGAVGVALVVAVGTVAAFAVPEWIRLRAELSGLRRITEVTQSSLLLRIPPKCGSVRIAARYLAAAPHPGVGGDLYDVLSTPFGVRVIIGDVKGYGLDAFAFATDILERFRDLAGRESTLAGVTRHLDAAVAGRRAEHPEEFATALLLEIPDGDGDVRVVCCGHPAPLLLRRGRMVPIDFPRDLPLGLLGQSGKLPTTSAFAFGGGDRLLLYTDGLTEARDPDGRFFPLPEFAAPLAARADEPGELLARVESALVRHSRGRLHDDIALLVLKSERAERVATGHDLDLARRHGTALS